MRGENSEWGGPDFFVPEHPRVRGENRRGGSNPAAAGGTSPRARGKRGGVDVRHKNLRNIPACAGKTGW